MSPSLVITAGACTDPASPKIDEIVAGTLNRVIAYPGQQVRKPRTIVPHPGYTFPPYNDISLIFLDEPFVFHENISAVALPEVNQTTYPSIQAKLHISSYCVFVSYICKFRCTA